MARARLRRRLGAAMVAFVVHAGVLRTVRVRDRTRAFLAAHRRLNRPGLFAAVRTGWKLRLPREQRPDRHDRAGVRNPRPRVRALAVGGCRRHVRRGQLRPHRGVLDDGNRPPVERPPDAHVHARDVGPARVVLRPGRLATDGPADRVPRRARRARRHRSRHLSRTANRVAPTRSRPSCGPWVDGRSTTRR